MKKMELKSKESVKKAPDGYIHTIKVTYPSINVINMKKAWSEAVDKYNEWLSNYDGYVEETRKTAELSVESEFEKLNKEITEIMAMDKEQRYNHWNEKFLSHCKEVQDLQTRKEELIKETYEKNKEVLQKYKQTYEEDMKNKKAALKKWDI
jgi:hypothetical protein